MKRKADFFIQSWENGFQFAGGHMVFQSSVVQLFPDLPLPSTLRMFCELFWHFRSSAIALVVIFDCI